MSTITELIGEVGIEPEVNRMLSFEDCFNVEEFREMSNTFEEKSAYGDNYYTPPRASILVHKNTPHVDIETLIETIESL